MPKVTLSKAKLSLTLRSLNCGFLKVQLLVTFTRGSACLATRVGCPRPCAGHPEVAPQGDPERTPWDKSWRSENSRFGYKTGKLLHNL